MLFQVLLWGLTQAESLVVSQELLCLISEVMVYLVKFEVLTSHDLKVVELLSVSWIQHEREHLEQYVWENSNNSYHTQKT